MASKLTTKSKKSTIRKAWIAALRSGKYKQTTGRLKGNDGSTDGYCCLGVLCDLAVKAGVIKGFKGDAMFPGPKVKNWAGLRDACGAYQSGGSLAEKNDGGASFKTIAKLIEKQPKGLFV